MRIRARWAVLVTAVVAAVAVTPASPAHAAVGCTGDGCAGQMASSMGCVADAIGVAGFGDAQVDQYTLFYSPACHAVWAEGVTYGAPFKGGAPNPAILQVWHQSPITGETTPMNDNVDASSTASTVDTPMVNWDDSAKVCVNGSADPTLDPYPDPHGGIGTYGACSSWR